MPENADTQIHSVVVSLIDKAGMKLKLPSSTIARAMIIYHHFKRCVGHVEYEPGLSAAAALGIAAKVDEEKLNRQCLVIVFWSIMREKDKLPKLNSEEFKQLEKSVTNVQFFFCRMLKFNLKHEMAHQYIGNFLRCLNKRPEFKENWDFFINVVWKIVSTVYLTRQCLDFEASEVAVACLHIACTFCKINVESLKDWQQALSLNEKKLNLAICGFLSVCSAGNLGIENQ